MLKVVQIKPSGEITVDELIESIKKGEPLMVFYRTKNRVDGSPVFLKWRNGQAYFISAVPTYGTTYESNTLRETIQTAMISRILYVTTPDEFAEMFNKLL